MSVHADRLLGIVRQPSGLFALTSQRVGATNGDVSYAISRLPLTDAPKGLAPRRDELIAAWHALAEARRLDATTLHHVLTVLDRGAD